MTLDIEKLAREAEHWASIAQGKADADSNFRAFQGVEYYVRYAIIRAYQSIISEVLEQAAQEIDRRRVKNGDGYDLGIEHAADSIRAMKPKDE